jgi:rhodanese-related sulfurtransferase
MTYAGDLSPQATWDLLVENPQAVLVDVRTSAEWSYVGIPDLASIGKEVKLVAWVEFPQMEKNQDFVAHVRSVASDTDAPLLFICRSGVRSIAAAEAMTHNGFTACYNVLEGFEGDKNDQGQRNSIGGWRFIGLSWLQG